MMREREALFDDNARLRALLREHADWHAGSEEYEQSPMGVAAAAALAVPPAAGASFQERVAPWMIGCFGPEVAGDREERTDRLLEEAIELTQAVGLGRARAHALVDYVHDKDGGAAGEPVQEVGGVMVTLAALCLAHGLDMHGAGEAELARVCAPETMEKIRIKQAAKPKGSALPVAVERWRHLRRGTEYTVVGRGTLQNTGHGLYEGEQIIAYRGGDGRLWFRPQVEFFDGRFERVAP